MLLNLLFFMTTENLTSLAKVVPDLLDYTSNNKLIDFNKNIDQQMCKLLDLSGEQFNQIKYQVDSLRVK